jgi:hypothetical protein
MKNQIFEMAPFFFVSVFSIPNNKTYPSYSSNPAAPTGRRSKLSWTEEEEAALRVTILFVATIRYICCLLGLRYLQYELCYPQEAMEKFTPRDNGAIPWVQILEQGRNVFHKTRLPCDLRVKWRNMKKKTGS